MTQNNIRNEFHSDLASLISNEIQFKQANYYYFLGKVDAWGNVDTPPTNIQTDSEYENTMIRSNMVFMRKITPNDISLVTKNYQWETGLAYQKWDHTKNLNDVMFYCTTIDSCVYKCLDNAGGALSTVSPTEKSFYPIKTSDGYTWKYMFTVPSFKQKRFTNSEYIPVQRSLSDSFYNKGSIDMVTITDQGEGYTNIELTTISVSSSTTGEGATGNVVVDIFGGVNGFNITNGGNGYTDGVRLEVLSESGFGCILTPVIIDGVVTTITVTSPGTNYQHGENINFIVGGAILVPAISRTTGSIDSVYIYDAGIGYTTNTTLTVHCINGTGKFGNVSAILSAIVMNGKIVRVNIIDPGIGYLVDSSTSIVVQGDGTGADFSPVIQGGKITGIIVENSGIGYTNVKLTVVGTGIDALLQPIISTSDFISDQSTVEQTTIMGAIYSIQMVDGGTNYSEYTTMEINGDGIGCIGFPVIEFGIILYIVITNAGSGYTYANVTFTDPTRLLIVDKDDAISYVIFPPSGGHGFNAITELFGTTIAINTSLRQELKLNTINQDYRQYGILRNPTNLATNKLFLDASTMLTYSISMISTNGLVIDEILVADMVKFRVVYVIGNTVILQKLGTQPTTPIGMLYAENENTRTYNSIRILEYPKANKYSGSLVYISNESPFSFTPEQGISIKTFLKF